MTKHKSIFLNTLLWCRQGILFYPWTLLILSFLACAYTSYYVYNHLTVNTNTAEMLSPDLPFQKNQKRIENAFPLEAATIILVVEADTPEETSQASTELAATLSQHPQHFHAVYTPTENDFFRQQALLYLEPGELENLAKKLTDAQPFIGHLAQNYSLDGLLGIIGLALEKQEQDLPMDLDPLLHAINTTIQRQLAGNPHKLSWQELLAENKLNTNAKRSLVVAKPIMDFSAMLPSEQAQLAVRAASQELMAKNPSVKVRITGETALEHEELESVSNGAQLSGIVSFVLVCVIQWIGIRSFKLLISTYIVLVMGLIFTAGFAAISVGHLNVISIAFASLYIGLGVDYAIHICLYYREHKADGYSNMDAILYSLEGVGSSLCLCALSTVIGFIAFIPTDYAGVSELGIISGGGIIIGLIISLTVMPALLNVMPVNHPKPIHSSFSPNFLVTFPFHFAKSIKWVSILLAIASCFILTKLTFDSNPINLRDPHSESVITIKELLRSQTDSPFALTSLADSLPAADALAAKMAQLPSVHEAITLSSFVAKDQEEKLLIIEDLNLILGNQLTHFSTQIDAHSEPKAALLKFNATLKQAISEGNRQAPLDSLQQLQSSIDSLIQQADAAADPAASYSLLEHNLLDLLPFTMQRLRSSLSATDFGLEDIPDYLRIHWVSKDGVYKVLIAPKKDQNIIENQREFVAEAQAVDSAVSGLPVANHASGDAVVKAFVQAFSSAFLAIFILLLIIYRNLKHTLLVILPLSLAALLTGATNVLLDNPFNFANIIALPLLLGMGIDSSILIMHKLHFNLDEDENLLQTSTTRGIIFASITTLCSFSSLGLTGHQGMASMGILLSIGLLFTVLCSLIVLPAFSGKRI